MISYMVMGAKDSQIAPGWWNWYKEIVYAESGYDLEKMDNLVKEDLMEQVDFFVANPNSFVNHYYQKTVSQWTESSYQSIWLSEIRYAMHHQYKDYDEVGNWVYSKYNSMIDAGMDLYNTILYCGAFVGVFTGIKQKDSKKLILPLILTGGFLYHLLFEAKSQYLIIYAMILIPYAAQGINRGIQRIEQKMNGRKQK